MWSAVVVSLFVGGVFVVFLYVSLPEAGPYGDCSKGRLLNIQNDEYQKCG
jgi:hypothetical protein